MNLMFVKFLAWVKVPDISILLEVELVAVRTDVSLNEVIISVEFIYS